MESQVLCECTFIGEVLIIGVISLNATTNRRYAQLDSSELLSIFAECSIVIHLFLLSSIFTTHKIWTQLSLGHLRYSDLHSRGILHFLVCLCVHGKLTPDLPN